MSARRSCGNRRRGSVGHEPIEVRQPPRDGHPEAGRRRRVVALEPGEQLLELALGAARGPPRSAVTCRGEDLVVERRHEHLDVVGVHDPDAVEQMLLGQRPGPPPRPAAVDPPASWSTSS